MKTFVKENTWLSIGGWGNGYVIIPKGHPLYGKDYNEIHDLMPTLIVHGGLTYSSIANHNNWEEIPKDSDGGWVVGFDTAHYGDHKDKWDKEAVIKETRILKDQLLKYKK